eukprot:26120-Chlamydomonas_euryale.AAC.1
MRFPTALFHAMRIFAAVDDEVVPGAAFCWLWSGTAHPLWAVSPSVLPPPPPPSGQLLSAPPPPSGQLLPPA